MWFFSSKKTPQYKLQKLIFQSNSVIQYYLYDGFRISDQKQFSIFEIKTDPTSLLQQALSKNALKIWKTLRHPAIPIFYDSYENDDNLYVVTEKLLPFNNFNSNDTVSTSMTDDNLESDKQTEILTDNEILWAVHVLTDFVCFLGDKANAIHGSIQNDSLFMTHGHELKIAGLHWMTINGNGPINDYYNDYQNLVLNVNQYLPNVEIQFQIDPNAIKEELAVTQNRDKSMNFYSTVDSKFIGLFISKHRFQLPERVISYGDFWLSNYFLSFSSYYASSGNIPPTPKMFLDDELCWNQYTHIDQSENKGNNNEYINIILFLKDLPLKEADDRLNFFQHLNQVLNIFSIQTQEYTILPILISSLSYTKSLKETPLILEAVFSIGSNPQISNESFENIIIPSIIPLFESKDRNIRIHLLKNIDSLINHFTPKLINETIFPNIIVGLSDTVAAMKSATIISMVSFAPKLSKDNIKSLIRELRKLQTNDQDPSIRCNSVICITKISENIDEEIRISTLLLSFTAALKDSFSSSRKAAITGFKICKKYFAPKSDIIANNILVALAPLCNDSSIENRILAIETMKDYLDTLMNENNPNNQDSIIPPNTPADEQIRYQNANQPTPSLNNYQYEEPRREDSMQLFSPNQSKSAFPPPPCIIPSNLNMSTNDSYSTNSTNDSSYHQSNQSQGSNQFSSSSVIAHYPSSDQNYYESYETNNDVKSKKNKSRNFPLDYDDDEYWRIIKSRPPKQSNSKEVRDAMMLFANSPVDEKS